MSNVKQDATAWALWVSNDMEYGDFTNGEVVSEWSDERCVTFCQDYLDHIIAINGTGELMRNERQMAKELHLMLDED